MFASAALGPGDRAEQSELLEALGAAIEEGLTPHQRQVLVALALNGVPIDVLAERLGTTRGLYKTLRRPPQTAPAPRRLRPVPRHLAGGVMDRPDLRQALGRLRGPDGPEVGCETCFEELDRYVELELAGADADAAVPVCGPTSTAARRAGRSTRACSRSSVAKSRSEGPPSRVRAALGGATPGPVVRRQSDERRHVLPEHEGEDPGR